MTSSFESDFRFARPPNEHTDSHDSDDEEPLFGETSFNGSSNGGDASWRRRFRAAWDDGGDEQRMHGRPHDAEDSFLDEKQAAGPASDENCELYALLNLDKDASTQDILRSYRALAVAFHPDKHSDEALKTAAQTRFQKIQHAYEVLSDQHKRAVYDLLGEEGLKSEWQVGQKLKSPDELRAEYEKIKLKRAQADIENLIRSKTEAVISLDASRVVNPDAGFLYALAALPAADIRQLFMKASAVSVLTPNTVLSYSGTMLARRGSGGGNLLTTIKHQYSPRLSLEAATTLLQPRLLNAKAAYQFPDDSFLNVETSIKTLASPPPLSITYGRRIANSMTGFARLSTGTSYAFLALVPYAHWIPFLQPRNGTISNLTLGVAAHAWSVNVTSDQLLNGQVSASYGGIRMLGGRQHGWKLSTSIGVGFDGSASVNINTDKRLTENTTFGLGIGAGILGGALSLRLRVSRLGQKLTVPIVLSQAASVKLVLSTICLPGVTIASLQHFYWTPKRRKRISDRLHELREEQKERNAERMKEAHEAQELLAEQVARKKEVERAKDGLIILEAKYRGAGRHLSPEELKDTELDVTIALQALVTSSTAAGERGTRPTTSTSALIVPGGRSKAHIIGFYDILVGSKKELAITYTFSGRRHHVVYDDFSPVALPMRSHLVE